jgi:septal ring factor EnvC (AmiA/AmiB activator)
LLLLAPDAAAQESSRKESPEQALRRVEEQVRAEQARQKHLDQQSYALQKELEELRDRLVGLADQERAQAEELDEQEETMAALRQEEQDQSARLDAERQQIAELLGALQRLARIPPEAALARPEGPVDTLRSALLLRDTVPALRSRAETLAGTIRRLAGVRERLEEQRTRSLAAQVALAERRTEIAGLVARREELSRQTDEERAQLGRNMARLSDQAGDLRQLMERIEAERRAAELAEAARQREAERREAARIEAERRKAEQALAARQGAERKEAERRLAQQKADEQRVAEQRAAEQKIVEQELAEQKAAEQRIAEQKAAEQARLAANRAAPEAPSATTGGLRLPVGGRVLTPFGGTDRLGSTSRGLTISARPGSAVVSPLAGSIVFAGPFRGYGQILIVEHGNGYHSLIAGLGRIDTAVGKRVASGEPIALMPTDGTPDLYFELRRHGQPIDPQGGSGTPKGKGQG